MEEPSGDPFSAILEGARLLFSEDVDFSSSEPDVMAQIVTRLTVCAQYFNVVLIQGFGGKIGPLRQAGLVEQAVAAAFQTFGGVDPHPDPFDKAAMLLRGITAGHPFSDANKRTGFMTVMYYLDQVGQRKPDLFDIEAVIRLCLEVSAGSVRDVELIADRLRDLWQVT